MARIIDRGSAQPLPAMSKRKSMPEDAAKMAVLEEKRKALEMEHCTKPCPECGFPLTVKRGRYGFFIGCTGYPTCNHLQKIQISSGVKCDKCGKGELVEKRTRRGKVRVHIRVGVVGKTSSTRCAAHSAARRPSSCHISPMEDKL